MAIAFATSSTLLSSFQSTSYLSLRTRTHPPSLPCISPILIPSKKFIIFHEPAANVISQRNNRLGPIPAAAAEDVVPSEAAAVDAATEQLVANTDGGVSTVISALLFAAFIGLSILTIGVIYLGVTDFLQKREKEKFEKEEAADKSGKKKKKKKKKGVRARPGPRGFGQKIDEDEDDD